MEIIEFCTKINTAAKKILGKTVEVHTDRIVKNNGVILHSIIIAKKGSTVSPNIYLDDLFDEYKEGRTLNSILEEVVSTYEEGILKKDPDMGFFMDYEAMKEYAAYKIINQTKNKELLEKVPHILFLDLAIVFYCLVPNEELECATILIHHSHLQMWGVSKERLYTDAVMNTQKLFPAKIQPIEEIMEEILKEDLRKEFSDMEEKGQWIDETADKMVNAVTDGNNSDMMFVLGNKQKLFGAAAMLYEGLLVGFADRMNKDLYILPSSVHEVILVPDNGEKATEDLWNMVCEINSTQVDPEDVLADSVYYFKRQENKIKKLM